VKAGFSRRLITGVRTQAPPELAEFIDKWRQDLRAELCYNHSGHLGTRHASLADSIAGDFPDLSVLDLYLHPAVHPDELDLDTPLTFSNKEHRAADLAHFSASHFQWARTAHDVIKRFAGHFFPGMAVRQLVQAAKEIDNGQVTAGSGCPMIGKIVGERKVAATCFLEEVRVLLIIPSRLIRQICASLPGPGVPETAIKDIERVSKNYRAWLPAEMVRVVLPDRLAEFKLKSTGGKKCLSKCNDWRISCVALSFFIRISRDFRTCYWCRVYDR
jgi:Holliday junction resolvase YEN1